jgi:hypothetical protein
MFPVRRVVTGRNAQGRSVVLSDGPPPPADFAGQVVLWSTDAMPARPLRDTETDATRGPLPPPPSGTRILLFEIGPEDKSRTLEERARRSAEMFARLGVPDAQVDTTRDPGMHRTHTIDYIIVLSGEITLLLDEGEVPLKPFDVVVQQSTNHAWVNRGTQPVTMAAVILDAVRA